MLFVFNYIHKRSSRFEFCLRTRDVLCTFLYELSLVIQLLVYLLYTIWITIVTRRHSIEKQQLTIVSTFKTLFSCIDWKEIRDLKCNHDRHKLELTRENSKSKGTNALLRVIDVLECSLNIPFVQVCNSFTLLSDCVIRNLITPKTVH